MLQIRDVSKRFPTAEGSGKALDRLSLTIETGSFFTLVGASGCGKSTLLRCIAGLETADEGDVDIAGRTLFSAKTRVNVPTHRRRIGMVFQSYAIWPHMTVFANVAFPLEVQKAADIRGRVMRSLEIVGLDNVADRAATQLSGGQQQRVALAGAIVAPHHPVHRSAARDRAHAQDAPDWPLRCRVTSGLAIAAGDIVEVTIDPGAVHVIPDGERR